MEFHNYGLSDDIHHGPGLVEDPDAIIYKIIDKLDDLTDNLNKDWCEKRILTSIEVYMALKDNISPCGLNYSLVDMIVGIFDSNDGYGLSTLYLELSVMNTNTIDDDSGYDKEQIMNIYHIWYYNCEGCGQSSSYGEAHEVDNKLLCCDCHFNLT